MKPIALLDLSVFSIPNAIDDVESLYEIFECLQAWAEKLGKQNCVDVVISDNAIEALQLANCFPATHNLKALLEIHSLDNVLSARDLNKSILKILSRAMVVSDIIKLEIEENDADCSGIVDLRKISHVIADHTKNTLCVLAAYLDKNPNMAEMISIVPGFGVTGDIIEFQASNITARDGESLMKLRNVSKKIRVSPTPKDFISKLDPDILWKNADNGNELSLPISMKAANKLNLAVDNLPLLGGRGFTIGEYFYDSLIAHEATGENKHASTTLEKCSLMIANIGGLFERNFGRERRIDGANSRRVHLTKGGLGLRLMFWLKMDNNIEFANIGPKHEMNIVEGNPESIPPIRF